MIIRRHALEQVEFGGLKICDYTAEKELKSSLATIEVPFGSGHPKAFSRLSDKYYLVTHGRVRFVINDEVADLEEGDFCFVRRGTVFSYENLGSDVARLVLVHTPAFDLSAEVFVE